MPNTVKFNEDYPVITKSDELYERALKVQKPITQTLAKGPGQFTKGVAPKYIQRGKGSHVWDVDGNEYIDYNAAIGPLSLGYAYPAVDEAIKKQLEDGIIYVSHVFGTAIHNCACGCGSTTVTPLRGDGWHFVEIDGKVTLSPSIGNFSFPCKSHYFIRDGKIEWC